MRPAGLHEEKMSHEGLIQITLLPARSTLPVLLGFPPTRPPHEPGWVVVSTLTQSRNGSFMFWLLIRAFVLPTKVWNTSNVEKIHLSILSVWNGRCAKHTLCNARITLISTSWSRENLSSIPFVSESVKVKFQFKQLISTSRASKMESWTLGFSWIILWLLKGFL